MMDRTQHAIRASYASCRRMARRAGSNFYPCFLLLGRPKRRAMDALYAFMRHSDDLVDNPQPLASRRDALARWRTLLETALAGDRNLPDPPEPQHDRLQRPYDRPGEALLPALVDTVRRFQIPAEHLHAVLDGVEMDLAVGRYETFDDLVAYCERVASAVGLACIHVWGFRGEEALPYARACGIAFQVTNILRDLREDARRGRIYLPLEDLRLCSYSPEDLARGVADERFLRVMELEIDRVDRLYREGAELFQWLEPDGRRVFGMMMTVYHRLFQRIRRRPGDVLLGRVRLGRAEKLRIAARWLLLPPRRAALP